MRPETTTTIGLVRAVSTTSGYSVDSYRATTDLIRSAEGSKETCSNGSPVASRDWIVPNTASSSGPDHGSAIGLSWDVGGGCVVLSGALEEAEFAADRLPVGHVSPHRIHVVVFGVLQGIYRSRCIDLILFAIRTFPLRQLVHALLEFGVGIFAPEILGAFPVEI